MCACGCSVLLGQTRNLLAADCIPSVDGGIKLSDKRIGTWAWAKETGGRLHPSQRDAVLREMLKAQARCAADLSRPARDAIAKMDIDLIRVPDSALAKKVESHVSKLSPASLTNHVHRTYYWGSLLAQADGARIDDEELFYVAALLHDLGITDQHRCAHEHIGDFSVDGGVAAHDFLVGEGVTQERADAAAEAIVLHVQIVGEEFGAMAKYLQDGAWTDLSCLRASEIPVDQARKVFKQHPALDIRKMFGEFAIEEITKRPDTRFAVAAQAGQQVGAPQLFPWPDRPEKIG